MKKIAIILILVLVNFFSGMSETILNIVPTPNKIVKGEGTFIVRRGLHIVTSDPKDFSAKYLQDKLGAVLDFPIALTSGDIVDKYIKFVSDSNIPKEGYRLEVGEKGIIIASSDNGGKHYGVQTLLQLFPAEIYSGAKLRIK